MTVGAPSGRSAHSRRAKEKVIARIVEVFRKHGYDGATLSRLIKATGLRHASLYHYFPDGKEGMARAALDDVGRWFKSHVLAALDRSGAPEARLKAAADAIDTFYRGGRLPCLLAAVALSPSREALKTELQGAVDGLVGALARTLVDAGLPAEEAHRRAEDAIVRLQGALIVDRAAADTKAFRRFIDTLPDLARRPA